MIEFTKVSKKFGRGENVAVDQISMTIPDNSITILVGPSGCGKTTTLKMINRLVHPDSGDIKLNGASIFDMDPVALRRGIGYVIQEIGLFPHMTIYENIAVVPRLLNYGKSQIKERVYELLDLINLEPDEFINRYPSQLSGGQQQRIGVIRALAADPDILLMDEPFGAVDPINREVLQDAFLEIQSSLKKTIVMVTHDIREAVKMGDYISVMDEGKIVQFGETSEVVKNPANDFVRDLLGADRAFHALETFRVRDIMSTRFTTVSMAEEANSAEIVQKLQQGRELFSFVTDEKNRLMGYINTDSMLKQIPWSRALRPIETVRSSATLREAMSHIISSGVSYLPVTDDQNRMKGIVLLRDAMKHIERENLENEGP